MNWEKRREKDEEKGEVGQVCIGTELGPRLPCYKRIEAAMGKAQKYKYRWGSELEQLVVRRSVWGKPGGIAGEELQLVVVLFCHAGLGQCCLCFFLGASWLVGDVRRRETYSRRVLLSA